MVTSATISRNTSLLVVSAVLQKILSFAYFSYLATQLGVQQTGLYFFVLSLTAIFGVFIDFGVNNALIKKFSADPAETQSQFGVALAGRLTLGLVMAGALVLFVHIMPYEPLTRLAAYVAAVIMLVDSFTLLFYSVWRSQHRTVYEAWGNIIFQVVLVIAGGLVLYLNPSVQMALVMLLLASFVNFVFSWVTLRRRLLLSFKMKWQASLFRNLYRLAWPFALAGIASRLYGYADTFLLKSLAGNAA
ncbi:MAG: oligosaccharide flippase family protein, partial [Candidatus Komeilibacteria bacterium]|nr:oligosaccharide flippase family protein [Candidatus Komeilibacteria bacterium]